MSSFGPRRSTNKVYLNVYDLAPVNECLHPIGLGMYHTGVEVLNSEYTFASQVGVFYHNPREVPPNATFREQIYMGEFNGGHVELRKIIDTIKNDFTYGPNDYNILSRNCNHFANTLCHQLVHHSVPAYINRLADIGNFFSCLIPQSLLQQAPVTNKESNTNLTESQPFLMTGPMNRGMSSTTQLTKGTTAFSGAGTVLGGGSTINTRTSSSITNSTGSSNNHDSSIIDRREKVRAAALARFEIQQSANDSDKSM